MKKSKKSFIKVCLMGMIGISFLSACGTTKENNTQDTNAEQEEITTVPSEESENNQIKYEADLTDDGVDETIIVDVSKIKEDGQEMAAISVTDAAGKVLWSDEMGLAHMEWKSYYLTNINGKYSILRYSPDNTQGMGTYVYERFTLNDKGEQLIETKEVEFQTYAAEENTLLFPIEDMLAFADSANASLSNSFLLLSTCQGELQYGTEETQITYIEEFQGIIPDDIQREELTLKEKLEKTKERILEEYSKKVTEDSQ